uniref:PseudoU_synth_2 domain-containing protein n=1 Tax=Globodera pallida TaxID=36090 RepID=A0A183BLY6_GLOPA
MSWPETSDDKVTEDQAKKTDLGSKYAQWERLAKEWEPEEEESGGVDTMFKKIYRDADDEVERNGLKELWALVDPIWKFNKEELVDYMAKRVIFESEDIIAFDKPFQLAIASGPKDQAQLDRILQSLKERVAPGIDRLHIVSPLDKDCSGVIIYAKSRLKQLELKALLAEDKFLFRYRCLCKNIPREVKARISIPMIRVRLKRKFFFIGITLGLALLVRSHLYYGLNCPIVGDKKYVKAHLAPHSVLSTAISPNAMTALSLRKNDIRKMPMFMHRAVVHVPLGKCGDKTELIRAEMPPFFVHALKRLHLLKNAKCQSLWTCGSPPLMFKSVFCIGECRAVQFCSFARVAVLFLWFRFRASMLRLSVRPSPTDLHIDKRWDGMVSALVLRVLQIETELWRLSTLGGAASAMGFFSPQFTQYAFMISVKQLRLAFLVGDPVLVSRCFLYISLAFAQKGCYRIALKILRQEWVRGKELGSTFLLNCARGVWSTIKWRMKNKKVSQRITN